MISILRLAPSSFPHYSMQIIAIDWTETKNHKPDSNSRIQSNVNANTFCFCSSSSNNKRSRFDQPRSRSVAPIMDTVDGFLPWNPHVPWFHVDMPHQGLLNRRVRFLRPLIIIIIIIMKIVKTARIVPMLFRFFFLKSQRVKFRTAINVRVN